MSTSSRGGVAHVAGPTVLAGWTDTLLRALEAHGIDGRALARSCGVAAEGTTFRTLLRDVRRELAVAALGAGGRSVTEVANQLGFSETAAFSRAFKSWTGVPPSRMVR